MSYMCMIKGGLGKCRVGAPNSHEGLGADRGN
jgi:hypothetical protein